MIYDKATNKQMNDIKITLCSIVKNESQVLSRMLDSVKDIVDSYTVVDTGSTDNTADVLKERGIEPFYRAFSNFGDSRTHALHLAFDQSGYSDMTYILLLDADMQLILKDKEEFFTQLFLQQPDIVYIYQTLAGYKYKNTRLVKASLGTKVFYEGCTHEYVSYPTGSKELVFSEDVVSIDDRGDGGCRDDKFERDRRLLEAAIQSNPTPRYLFYLAQTYRDMGLTEKAIETYLKRIVAGGWVEEILYSRYRLVEMYLSTNQEALAVAQADHICSGRKRPEPFNCLCEYYRNKGDIPNAVKYFTLAQMSLTDVHNELPLFYDTRIEEYLLPFQEFMLWYYLHVNYRGQVHELAAYLLTNPAVPEHIRQCVHTNYEKFYLHSV